MKPDVAVCVKVVPKPEEVAFDPQTKTLDRGSAENVLNPADKNALEAALGLRDVHGGSVSVVSMGPPFAADVLDLCLGMGADRAILASDRLFAGADTFPTSRVLAHLVKRLPRFDLVLCGEEAADSATGQVPAGIAEWLNIPQATLVDGFRAYEDGGLIVRRRLDDAVEVLWAPFPVLVSIVTGSNKPRFPRFDPITTATGRGHVEVISATDLGLTGDEVGLKGSYTTVDGLVEGVPRSRRREFVRGTMREQADEIAKALQPYLDF